MHDFESDNGFTLIEVIISVAILAFVSISLVSLFTSGFRGIFRAGHRSVEHFAAQEYVENVLATNNPGAGTPSTLTMTFNDMSGSGLQNHSVTINGGLFEDPNGYITAFMPTETIFTVTPVVVTGVSVTPASINLFVGNTFQLNVSVIPPDATNKSVTWSSSNPLIASVTNGLVTAISIGGPVTISARTTDGNFIALCIVNITSAITFSSIINGQYIELPGQGLFQKIADNVVLRRANTGTNKWEWADTSALNYHTNISLWALSSRLMTAAEVALLTVSIRDNDSNWWTATLSSQNNNYRAVNQQGELFDEHRNTDLGVRPRVTLRSGLVVLRGNGTQADPFVLFLPN